MKKIILFIVFITLYSTRLSAQKKYKQMITDNSINFYDVVKEAQNYFKTHDKGKGSGWKGYQRWRNANEYKYYPSGNRNNIDPLFTAKAYQSFLKKNSISTQQRNSFTGWNELGPSRLTTFTGGYSNGLGRIEDHYVDPNNANRMYVGSRSGGFWKSLDGGVTWSGGSTDFLVASGVNTIGVMPTNPNQILINVRNSSNGYSHGVYRSTDAGDTWVQTNFNPTNLGFGGLGSDFRINTIAYHPTIANLVFISTNKGIFKSTDNLTTWTSLMDTDTITEIKFHPTNPNIIYILNLVFPNRILRSTDTGNSYTPSNGIGQNSYFNISVSNACPNCVYVANSYGIWKSTDLGVNFTYLNNPEGNCGGFTVSDTDNTKMIYGYLDTYGSIDDGNSFNKLTSWYLGSTNGDTTSNQTSFETSTNYIHADLHPAKSVNGVFYVGTDGLFCKSTDNGTNWEIIGQGIAVRENYKLGVSQSNTLRSISGSQDNGTSIKTENGWIEFYGADGMEGIIHPLNDDWMIGSLQNGGRLKTIDGGQTQIGATPTNSVNAAWEAPIAYDPNNQMTIYDFRQAVHKSDDFGTSWTTLGSPSFGDNIRNAAIAENNSQILVVSKYSELEKSTDGGTTWLNITGSLPNLSITDIAFDPKDDNTIIVTYADYTLDNNKVFITTNGGVSWSNITHNLGNMPIHSVVIDHTPEKNIYLGAEIGVYTKTMHGNSWSLYNNNLANTTIEELEIVYGSNTLKAATWGRGLWEYTLVGRNDFPSINTTKITDQPTTDLPKFGSDQFVTSNIEYNGTLTNVHVSWSINNPLFDNTIAMTNTSGTTWVSDTAIPKYPVGTKVFFKVFATGNNSDTSETYKFMYTVKPFEYCTAQSNSPTYEHITNVTLNTINNTSIATGYSDFTNISTDVTRGVTYNLEVSYSNNYNTDQIKVWIDFNNNASFTDAGETFIFPLASGTNSPFTQAITIPNNAKLGSTRMRIRLNDTTNGSNLTSCGSSGYGEVEDYTLNIISANLGIIENDFGADLMVYPNPTDGKLTLNLKEKYTYVKVTIVNMLGQSIQENVFDNISELVLNIHAESGTYFVKIQTDIGKKATIKILKK